jgi:hypothetical protein
MAYVECFVSYSKGLWIISKSIQWKGINQPLPGAPGNLWSVMSFVIPDQAIKDSQSYLARGSGETKLSCGVRSQVTGLRIHRHAAIWDGIWSKFRCSGESLAYVLGRVITAPAQHINQSQFALRHSRQYRVLPLEYETLLASFWNRCSCCLYLIVVLVHRKSLCTHPYDQLRTPYLPITVAIISV